ncbi:hypothetical protein [Nonomuraea diastatica]|uniref:Uncharacterized protein n=1 Tax=Nonomuraea diastatica TaxID=1848329 RepID=A0A4R4WHG5_9ACTN|nr:hypothetical protein [Nonomuraea diastatica]TDD13020.1 hypothetical protein E1294_42535 [Nonomuraea diastatica]
MARTLPPVQAIRAEIDALFTECFSSCLTELKDEDRALLMATSPRFAAAQRRARRAPMASAG